MTDRVRHELNGVIYRTYKWWADVDGTVQEIVIRVNRPTAVHVGGTTHILETEEGPICVVPAVGVRGCTLQYEKDPGVEKVQW